MTVLQKGASDHERSRGAETSANGACDDTSEHQENALSRPCPVEAALAEAVRLAAGAGEWATVATLAAELAARRREREGAARDVIDLDAERAKRRPPGE